MTLPEYDYQTQVILTAIHMCMLLTTTCTQMLHSVEQLSTLRQSIYDTTFALIPHLYLGICPHDKVLQLNDFVIYGRPVALFNYVVSCSPLSFFRWFRLLDTPRNLLDRDLFLSHHHRHCGQNGPIAPNKGLQRSCTTSVRSNEPI